MKFFLVCQFYLPYVLPRTPDWEGQGLKVQTEKELIRVVPRPAGAALYPNEIDKTLSALRVQLHRQGPPTDCVGIDMTIGCFDRVEAILEASVEQVEALYDHACQERYISVACEQVNLFLTHVRVASRAPFVKGVLKDWNPKTNAWEILNPYTVSCFETGTGAALPIFGSGGAVRMNATLKSWTILSPETGAVAFEDVRSSLSGGEEPELSAELLVDAEEYFRSGRLREGVILLAAACEVAADRYQSGLSAPDRASWRTRYDELKETRPSFARINFHELPRHLRRESLMDHDQVAFEAVERAYRFRNKASHEGKAYLIESNGQRINLDQDRAFDLHRKVAVALSWLNMQRGTTS